MAYFAEKDGVFFDGEISVQNIVLLAKTKHRDYLSHLRSGVIPVDGSSALRRLVDTWGNKDAIRVIQINYT